MDEQIKELIVDLQLRYFNDKEGLISYLGYLDHYLWTQIPGGMDSRGKANYIISSEQIIEKEEKPKEKKKINIIVANNTEPLDYINFLELDFEVNIIKFEKCKGIKIDLILFTGGEDVNPEIYDEKVGMYTSINKNRDNLEPKVFHSFKYIPKLCICRGAQFATVMSGGKLIQHVEGHGSTHTIDINRYGIFSITSTHHQMMYPFDLNEKDYELIAHSEYFKSKVYLNGDNKQIEKSKNFLEPEIVYYKNTKALCIQGHPEFNSCEKATKDICRKLICNYLFKENLKSPKLGYESYSNNDLNNFDIEIDNNFELYNHELDASPGIITSRPKYTYKSISKDIPQSPIKDNGESSLPSYFEKYIGTVKNTNYDNKIDSVQWLDFGNFPYNKTDNKLENKNNED